MNLNEYIKRRISLDNLHISDISRKKYNKEKNNYIKLIKISDDFEENNYDKIHKVFKYFSLIIPIVLSLILSLGYVNSDSHEINILLFILMIIVIPFIFMVISLIFILYKKSSNYCFSFVIENITKGVFQDGIKRVSCYYFQLISITFSLVSIIILLFLTAIESYKFYFATTWIKNTFFTSVIDFFSFPIKKIYPEIIPSNELIIESAKNASSDSIWLWFLISLVIVWIVMPRIISLIFALYFSRKSLKKSFLNNNKSKRILEYLKPKITTTNYVNEKENLNDSDLMKNNANLDIKKEDEEKQLVYSKILLYSLNENAISAIKNSTKYSNIDIETYSRNINFENFHSNILILINYQSAPKMIAVNMMRRLNHCSLFINFLDDNGLEVLNDANINEWKRFLKEKNINIEGLDEQ